MSGYPYGYPFQGGQPPPPPPQQQQYTPYQPYAAYPPPASGYGTSPPQQQQPQHYPPPNTTYYANAQSAYDYNANSIPGLGTPSSAAPFSAPYSGAWNQGAFNNVPPQAQYSTPQAPAPATYPLPQAPASTHRPPQSATPIQAVQSKQQSKPSPKSQSNPQPKENTKPIANDPEMQEDGEIDDGYFDDLYDDASKAPSVANDTAAVPDKASGNAAEDGSDQEPNFYDTDMEEASISRKVPDSSLQVKTKNSIKLPGRERSKSYSPHLSPKELRGDIQMLSNAIIPKEKAGIESKAQSVATVAKVASVPFRAQSNGNQKAGQPNAQSIPTAVNGAKTGATLPKSFASVSEAHNEAKKAILKLFPHGVKFQTYIDEGFDADVIKELFSQLNLPIGTAASVPPQKPAQPQDKDSQAPKSQLSQPTQVDTTAKTQEERKDRIARLLAEKQAQKAAKLAAASSNSGDMTAPSVTTDATNAVSTPSVPTPPVKPSVTKAENDRLLQQKVEALRAKARESKKLAQKSISSQVPSSDIAPKPSLPQISTVPTQPRVAAQSVASTPMSSASQSAAASPAISALPSSSRAGAPINQRKRPVAADFMDYQAPVAKRPSLANSKNSSFIISISDDEDEDDDDDVEMEVESATEDSPTPLHQPLNLPRRGGPSIRDFPPLKDFPNARQVSSPVSAMSSSGSKNANADLQSKERAIMEMNRRIKELEARKQAKIKSGNVTPQSPSAGGVTPTEQVSKPESPRVDDTTPMIQTLKTPIRGALPSSDGDDKTTPSAQLLQEAEAASVPNPVPGSAVSDRQSEENRQVRGPSAQVAGKSVKAQEKAARLRRMQEEMQRLQAEIEQDDDGDSVDDRGSQDVETGVEPDAMDVSQDMLATLVDESDRADQSSPAAVVPGEDGQAVLSTLPSDAFSQPQSEDADMLPTASDPSINATSSYDAVPSFEQRATPTPSALEDGKLPDTLDSAISTLRGGEPSVTTESAVVEPDESDDYEPPEPEVDERDERRSPVLEPMSTAADYTGSQPGGEVAETAREATPGTDPTRQTSFTPYKSPLRYYHAYRFHPNYNDGIHGGLKSLTYSNRIDPKKEMCPDEWEGVDCPRGSACQFQHFHSIIPPDSEIILELGSSDEFSGEKKKEFNNGLREVVASFQKTKVRDFPTIAGAIVDFRRRFLGDDSKVLHLEGVST